MDDGDDIVEAFLVESAEGLDELDRDLVALEQDPTATERLANVFRTIHTIKGTCGFLAFGELERLAHAGESLLSKLRDRELTMNPEIAEALLAMVDGVRTLLDDVARTGSDAGTSLDVDPLVAALMAVASGEPLSGSATPDTPAPAQASEPDVAQPESAEPDPVQPQPAAPVVAEAPAPEAIEPVAPEAIEPVAPEAVAPDEVDADMTESAAPEPAAPEPAAVSAEEIGEFHPHASAASVADASVRVDVELLDTLVRLVGELVLARNQIVQQAAADPDFARTAQRLNIVASELQESIMLTRMQPIGQTWTRFPRIVRDLATQLGKDIRLDMSGQDTELDRSLLDAVRDPLTHLVRNAIDHGIETPQERVAAGKPAQGVLTLRAHHESGQVVVEITDDGKGLDSSRIAAVAVQRGLVSAGDTSRMTERELADLIFRPGFSTATVVTNVSGRGVGMDVVRTNIERIGGVVDVSSRPGSGTTFRVRIPLTLAIIPALIVTAGVDRFAIPQANLVELVHLDQLQSASDIAEVAGAKLLRLRNQLLPLISLSGALGLPDQGGQNATVVVVQADGVRFGLTVDDVHETQEIVVKPLDRQLKQLPVYAGATIMGEGTVALILSIAGLAETVDVGASRAAVDSDSQEGQADTTALLVLDLGGGRRAAMPLAKVSRLEELPIDSIERTSSTEAVQYRDGILPLVRLAESLQLPRVESPSTATTIPVVVHEDGDRRIGLVAEQILDLVDTVITTSEVGRRPGVLGTAVIGDRITDLIDVDGVVALAGVS